MNILTENINQIWCSIIIDQLCRNDVQNFYVAPGMRNAPLLRAAQNHDHSQIYSFLDERALSYRALGYSKNLKIPALICTSGTAMANFLPSVIESYRSNQPMIIISADRPLDLVKTDANQTIDQTKVVNNYVCDSLYLDSPCESFSPKRLRTLIQNLINKAKRYKRPVHINVPLREPLNVVAGPVSSKYLELSKETFREINQPVSINYISKYNKNSEIEKLLKSAKSPLLVVGKIEQDIDEQVLVDLLEKINIPKYIDVTSKIKYHFPLHKKMSPSFDHPEVYKAYTKKKPDLIVHIGGRLISKHYYKFQEENPEIKVIHITHFDNDHDPGFSNNTKIICSIASFLNYMTTLDLEAKSPIDWNEFISNKREIIERSELSFPFISKRVIENSLSKTQLLIGNSTAIRSFDNYISLEKSYDYQAFSNRGVSGIEGFIATAIGLSDNERQLPYTLILGDISFKYDLNSLYMLNELEKRNITIIIVNDYGGGIFKTLPINSDQEYIDLLTTPHKDDFKSLVQSFKNIDYYCTTTKEEFIKSYQESQRSQKISIVEVIIDEKNNIEVFHQLKTLKL